nr:D-sedoheptulose 7-phosphate isomerase [Campylobacter pinnipediorum]
MQDMIKNELRSHIDTANKMQDLTNDIEKISKIITQALSNGNKILICGNGGSAADAQHFAAELIGRYKTERKALPAIAITTDTSALTAIGNDYGYDVVFSRQVEGLANKDDVLVGISTSGNSANVINAFLKAKEIGAKTIGLSGKDGGKMNNICDINFIAPSSDTPRIQEMHIFVIHTICQAVDNFFKQN